MWDSQVSNVRLTFYAQPRWILKMLPVHSCFIMQQKLNFWLTQRRQVDNDKQTETSFRFLQVDIACVLKQMMTGG